MTGNTDNFDRFFELSLDCMTVAGFDGYFKRLNPAWSRTLGWSMEELFSRPNIEFVHPDDRAATLAARGRLKDGVPLTGLHNRYLCKDGSYRWFDWRSIAHSEEGLVYAVARDITDQKRMQEQLAVSERMASIGRLAAGVAHEINNPLAFITANIRTVQTELRQPEALSDERRVELEEALSESLEGAERVRKIVRGLRTFARADAEKRTRIDLEEVIGLSLSLIGEPIRHHARVVERYGETPKVEADAAQLGDVFMHLFLNAFQAIPEEENGRPKEVRISTFADEQGRAVVELEDTGQGIPPEVVGRIFDPFFTTRPVGAGTGLGLSICHNIVVSLGGALTVRSEVGKGSTFTVRLPAAR